MPWSKPDASFPWLVIFGSTLLCLAPKRVDIRWTCLNGLSLTCRIDVRCGRTLSRRMGQSMIHVIWHVAARQVVSCRHRADGVEGSPTEAELKQGFPAACAEKQGNRRLRRLWLGELASTSRVSFLINDRAYVWLRTEVRPEAPILVRPHLLGRHRRFGQGCSLPSATVLYRPGTHKVPGAIRWSF